MDELQLLVDLHRHQYRQGPGGDAETALAIQLAGLDRSVPLTIADLGCGTGASTLMLARQLDARIAAVDFLPAFLDELKARAGQEGLAERITTLCASMGDLPFDDEAFDVIWSEGAIYNIGFRRGVAEWKRHLKPGGLLVVSEISWMTDTCPDDLQRHWEGEYPEIDTVSAKMAVLEESGYSSVAYFALPEHCWRQNYYEPLRAGFADFLSRNDNSPEARAIVEAERKEAEMYEQYSAYYSYGVYIAKKPLDLGVPREHGL